MPLAGKNRKPIGLLKADCEACGGNDQQHEQPLRGEPLHFSSCKSLFLHERALEWL
jgi:hypothetical protein